MDNLQEVLRERDMLREALEDERGKFQRETLRTSDQAMLLEEAEAALRDQHEPDSAAARIGRRGECARCALVLRIRTLRKTPINVPYLA